MARHKPVSPMRSSKDGGVKSRHRTRLARKSRQAVFGLRAKTACRYCSAHCLPQNIVLCGTYREGHNRPGFLKKVPECSLGDLGEKSRKQVVEYNHTAISQRSFRCGKIVHRYLAGVASINAD